MVLVPRGDAPADLYAWARARGADDTAAQDLLRMLGEAQAAHRSFRRRMRQATDPQTRGDMLAADTNVVGPPVDPYCRRVDVDWNAELVDQLEWHWQRQLRPRLDGLTDDEYFWQPVPGSWTLSRRGQSSAPMSIGAGEFSLDYGSPSPDRAPVTTIAWRLAHLIDVFGPPTAPHFDGSLARHRAVAYAGTASAALRQLDDGHDAWIGDVRHLGPAGLARPQGHPPEYADAPMAKRILHVHREVIHHGAEISLLRDLYLWKGSRGDLTSR